MPGLRSRLELPDADRADGEEEDAFERGFVELAGMDERLAVDRAPHARRPVVVGEAHRPWRVGWAAVEFAVDEVGDADKEDADGRGGAGDVAQAEHR